MSFTLAHTTRAQESVVSHSDGVDEVVSVNTNLVGVTIRVTDRAGRPLSVDTSSFRILADGAPQQIAFAEQDGGSTVAILVDASASMTGLKSSRARAGVRDFIERSDPRNRYVLFTFNERAIHRGTFGSDEPAREEINKTLKNIRATGETALYDACIEAGEFLTRVAGRTKRSLVVFTDGVDGVSKHTLTDLRLSLDSLGGLTYVVVLDSLLSTQAPRPSPLLINDLGRQAAMQLRMAVDGSVYHVSTDDELISAVREAGRSLMSAVQIGFYPSGVASHPGAHALQVETSFPSALVQARTRYLIK